MGIKSKAAPVTAAPRLSVCLPLCTLESVCVCVMVCEHCVSVFTCVCAVTLKLVSLCSCVCMCFSANSWKLNCGRWFAQMCTLA